MKDNILSKQTDWRFCRVRHGEKMPYPANWQSNPLTLDEVDSDNIGLLLGPMSNGIVALDFDGPSAWTWFNATIGCELPVTPMWTSGKDARCQMAFIVPEEYWIFLRTKKIAHTKDPLIAEGEGFEFRWAGGQSVMPPSLHPNGNNYEWIVPASEQVAELPDAILAYWLTMCNPARPPVEASPINLADITDEQFAEINNLLANIKQKHETLDYDTWRDVSWATAYHMGTGIATELMKQYWPEKTSGEYRSVIFRSYNSALSPKIGTLRHLAGVSKINNKMFNLQANLRSKYNLGE